MSAAANGRIMKELKEVGKNDTSGVQAKVINDGDIRHLRGTIQGPEGTPYEGGIFEIDIIIPKQYPFEPPKMKFMTKIWHPNISSQTGAICLDILKDNWSPALTIKTALLSLQALLCSAEPGDPQDAEVAKMYTANRGEFERTAKFWTESYAKPSSKEDAISRVCEMGFDRESARRALEKHDWDESAAVNALLGGI
ncbi:hypothetical protein ACA910_001333 [Epithemia clementina (nom. ined.)]